MGANINAQEEDGKTALMRACEDGNTDIADCLIENKADANIKDKNGRTALMYACKSEYSNDNYMNKLAQNLINENMGKANPNIKDNEGKTAFIHACESGNVLLASSLEKAKNVDIFSKDKYKKTGLSYIKDELNQNNIYGYTKTAYETLRDKIIKRNYQMKTSIMDAILKLPSPSDISKIFNDLQKGLPKNVIECRKKLVEAKKTIGYLEVKGEDVDKAIKEKVEAGIEYFNQHSQKPKNKELQKITVKESDQDLVPTNFRSMKH